MSSIVRFPSAPRRLANPCVYTGARVYIECHNVVVPADLHEVGNVTIIAMPGPLSRVGTYVGHTLPVVPGATHYLRGDGKGWVWLADSQYTPIIAVPMGDLEGERR